MSKLEGGDITKQKLIYSTLSHLLNKMQKRKQYLFYLQLCHFNNSQAYELFLPS